MPNLLSSQLFLSGITRSNISLLELQNQISSGKSINRISDDAVRSSAISVLQDRLERTDQRLGNLSQASGMLDLLDDAIREASDLVLEARSIASSQIGITSDAETRRTQAVVIDSMVRQLFDLANRERNNVHLFGGSTPGTPPIQSVTGGYRFVGRGSGLFADLGTADNIPITIGGENAIGETSGRLRSTADLNPDLTPMTRLADLSGARGLGVTLGVVDMSFNGGSVLKVDFTGCDDTQDIVERLNASITEYETTTGQTILGPSGVYLNGGSIGIDVVPGVPDPQLTFTDVGSGSTAADLGLSQTPFEATALLGADLGARLTELTPVSALSGLTLPLGQIRLRMTRGDSSTATDIDLSTVQTIGDLKSLIQTQAPGARVEINQAGTGINIYNEVSGPALSIEEIPGGSDTATELGFRSLSATTLMSDFNHGRGVRIIDGATNPVTGLPTAALNADFTVRLGNGDTFTVDLRPQDMTSVQTVLDRINAEALSAEVAGQIPPGSFSAGLTDGANGITFNDPLGLGQITVEKENNSAAAEDLGLTGATWDIGGARLIAQDRAAVRVNNLFTALLELADALRGSDTSGITVASEYLEGNVDRLASTRALVGVYASRVEKATARQEDLKLLDQRSRSELQDLDYTEAAIRLSQLQTQLTAGMQVAGQAQSRTLLDFLG
ncbi:MAG: hypothetical protein H7Y88_02775 [Phycisphaerales bacterium]|nr:hypothetical protein [Phycisphaerales bacterium]